MPQYDLYVSCTECNSVHPMGIGINLDAGPADQRSIQEAYDHNSLPPQIQAIEGHKALCLKTGNRFVQKDPKKIFLKPRMAVYRTPKQEEALGWPSRTSYRA
jgi:hypothetical protein